MPNGTGAGMGLESSIGTAGKSSKGASGKSTKGTVAKRGGVPARGAGRPMAGGARPAVAGAGRPGLTNVSQLLAGAGVPGGTSGAGVPTGMPGMFGAGIPSGGMPTSIGGLPTMPGDPSQYDFGLQNMGDLASLDFDSEGKSPTSYISDPRGGAQIGSVSSADVERFRDDLIFKHLKDLSPENREAFNERMAVAKEQKESGKWATGYDPETVERRITSAETALPPIAKEYLEGVRSWQTKPTALQNVGSMLKGGAKSVAKGVGGYLKDLGQAWGVYQKPLWPPSDLSGERDKFRSRIISGGGTHADERLVDEFISRRRAENYAAGITVPPGKEYLLTNMLGGESRQQGIPYGINITNAPGLSVPPQESQRVPRAQAATPSRQQTIPVRQMLQTGRPRTPQEIERGRGVSRGRGGYDVRRDFGHLTPEERWYLENAPATFGVGPKLKLKDDEGKTYFA